MENSPEFYRTWTFLGLLPKKDLLHKWRQHLLHENNYDRPIQHVDTQRCSFHGQYNSNHPNVWDPLLVQNMPVFLALHYQSQTLCKSLKLLHCRTRHRRLFPMDHRACVLRCVHSNNHSRDFLFHLPDVLSCAELNRNENYFVKSSPFYSKSLSLSFIRVRG